MLKELLPSIFSPRELPSFGLASADVVLKCFLIFARRQPAAKHMVWPVLEKFSQMRRAIGVEIELVRVPEGSCCMRSKLALIFLRVVSGLSGCHFELFPSNWHDSILQYKIESIISSAAVSQQNVVVS